MGVQAQFEDDEWCTGTVQKIKDNDRIRVVWEDNSYTDHTASELRPAPKEGKKDKKPPKVDTRESEDTEYEGEEEEAFDEDAEEEDDGAAAAAEEEARKKKEKEAAAKKKAEEEAAAQK